MTLRWEIEVLQYDTYGERVVSRTSASILADDKAEVTEKVRTVFNASYDSFRKFWSHGWTLISASEVEPAVPVSGVVTKEGQEP